ncbi:MAG TPA: alkaline phosphatase D family protein [Halococcus sp.]|nr:alkaline phosphatase D family protein [Halococcus sp.]
MTGDADGHDELRSLLSGRTLPIQVAPTETNSEDFTVESDHSQKTFPQSVASGGPTPSGVILWTRIDPAAYREDEPLKLEIAADESVTDVVYRGIVDADCVTPDRDYTVNVDTDGLLESDHYYYFQFIYDGVRSRIGRCHTLPAVDASPDSLRLAVLTCQDYQNGYYGAYHHIAAEEVDFLLHVGDFIYESANGQYKGRGSREYPDRKLTLPSGHDRVWSLDDYRYLYRTYRTDEFLQEALERHTLIAARDDHEFTNDIYWNDITEAPAGPSHPRGDNPEFMTRLVADALQAWWEYLPARVRYDPAGETFCERYRLWQCFRFGDLADLLMTDERLYRDPPRYVNSALPSWLPVSPKRGPPERSMLGNDQHEWFLDQLRNSEATWTVWSDEVLTVPFRIGAGAATVYPSQSGWDGYRRERRRIMAALDALDVSNFITLTGDMHCYVAGYQQTEYQDILSHLLDGTSAAVADTDSRVGVEFMTPALTSLNITEAVGANGGPLSDLAGKLLSWAVRAQNPHMEFFDSQHWGYSVVEFTPDDCTYTAYSVDKTENSPDAEKQTLVSLRVPEGRIEIEHLPTVRS